MIILGMCRVYSKVVVVYVFMSIGEMADKYNGN